MERIDYLPLGSIVLLKGGTKKLLVIARALNVQNGGKTYFFDYGAVGYPEGLTGDQMAYFNHQDLSKVLFEGYHDAEDENIVETIQRYVASNPSMLRGSADAWEE